MIRRWWRKIFILFIVGLVLAALFNSSWFLKLMYPFPHRDLVVRYCREYQVDPCLTLAIIRTESHFRSQAYSRTGARGLMQIMPETGDWIARQLKMDGYNTDMLYEPDYNIPMGIWYISYLEQLFGGSLPQMLAAYNAGENNVRKWMTTKTWTGNLQDINRIPYEETRDYIDKVLLNYQIYKRIYRNELSNNGF